MKANRISATSTISPARASRWAQNRRTICRRLDTAGPSSSPASRLAGARVPAAREPSSMSANANPGVYDRVEQIRDQVERDDDPGDGHQPGHDRVQVIVLDGRHQEVTHAA